MSVKFINCLAVTLAHEGGWSDHPSDPGGATMKGIILAFTPGVLLPAPGHVRPAAKIAVNRGVHLTITERSGWLVPMIDNRISTASK